MLGSTVCSMCYVPIFFTRAKTQNNKAKHGTDGKRHIGLHRLLLSKAQFVILKRPLWLEFAVVATLAG